MTIAKVAALTTTARHSSDTDEHFTPEYVVEAARLVLGTIDIDPATTAAANRRVRAARIFRRADNGYKQPWHGRVFLNPPGGLSDEDERRVRPKCNKVGSANEASCGLPAPHVHKGVQSSQKKWWFKLAREFAEGRTTAAIFVCFSIELLQTTQFETPLKSQESAGGELLPIPLDFPICFPRTRIAYLHEDGSVGDQPTHASCIVCVCHEDMHDGFGEAFSRLGRVIRPRGQP